MSIPSPIILVTGSNRGIGFSIIQSSALRYPNGTYILACRNTNAGQEAVAELRSKGVTSRIEALGLDVDDDASILKSRGLIEREFGGLDVLVNNAGVAMIPDPDHLNDISYIRETYNKTFNTNITSVATVTAAFLPLLRKGRGAHCGKVVNVGSARGSMGRSLTVPKTAVREYSVSKTALNALTLEMHKSELLRIKEPKEGDAKDNERDVKFWVINPGHCKTSFNGYRGIRDPVDGAEVVVRLIGEVGNDLEGGRFLETNDEGVLGDVPW